MLLAPTLDDAAVSISGFIASMVSFLRSVLGPSLNELPSPGITASSGKKATEAYGVMMVTVSVHVCRLISSSHPSATTT